MKQQLNEQGYALVTVLLMITIFSILSLSFASQAFTSTKQNKIVEERAQAVALAEMGVEYFKAAAENAYVESQDEVKKFIEEEIEKDRQIACPDPKKVCNFTIDEKSYLEKATIKMVEQLTSFLDDETKVARTVSPTQFTDNENIAAPKFEIIDGKDGLIKYSNDQTTGKGEITISFVSQGIEKENEKDPFKLGATLTLNINDLEFGEVGEDDSENRNNGGWDITFPEIIDFNTITKPDNVPNECREFGEDMYNCSNILISKPANNLYYDANNLSNKIIYFEKNATFNSSVNNMYKINLHSEESLTFRNPVWDMTNSVIESKGDSHFSGGISLKEQSKLLVGSDLNVTNPLRVNNNSIVYVNGNSYVSSGSEINNNSKLYVGGNAANANHLLATNNSSAYIKGNAPISTYLNSEDYSTIYINGEVGRLNEINSINSSKIYIGGNTIANNQTNIINNSSLYINGDFHGGNSINIDKNSKLCVNGNLNYYNKNNLKIHDSLSKVYFTGNNNGGNNQYPNYLIKVTTESELKELCGLNNNSNNYSEPKDPNFNWGNIKQDVDYQY